MTWAVTWWWFDVRLLGYVSTLALWTLFVFWLGGEIEVYISTSADWRRIEARQREIFCEQALQHEVLKTCYSDGLPPPMPAAVLDAKLPRHGG